ncbi:ATP-binding cassette domain-containing protein [Haloimpatiens sp. FM7330]|uniref:ATP-binding cassette domain-containing protein n=1 Tax=Haloimpatiens sp. FM7330 TaxID=3298610 RepID=UPI003641729F
MKGNSKDMKTSHCYWQLIKYKPWLYLFIVILWIVTHMMTLVNGFIIKEFFDIISGKSFLNIGISGLILLIIISTLLLILTIQLNFRRETLHKFSISTLLRRNMLDSILKKAGAKALQTSIGEAINSFRDDVQQVETSIGWLSWLIGQITFSIFSIIILLKINAKITLLVFVPVIAVRMLGEKLQKRIEKNREHSRQATADVTGAVGEIFESVLAIKVSGSQKYIVNNLKKLNEKRHHLMIKDSFLTQLVNSIYSNAVNLGIGLILLLAGQAMRDGSFSVGDFALFVYYLSFVTDSIESFGNFLINYKQTGISFKRMTNLIQSENSNEIIKHKPIYLKEKDINEHNEINMDFKHKSLNTLQVKGLNYCYENSEKGINNINFTLNKGEITVISGRTGSGKTTLLKTLLGLLSADSGEVYWNGEIVKMPKNFFIPPICAYTSQVPNLFSDTVRNNILLGISEESVDLKGAINSAVLEKDIEQFENGLDTVIGPKGVKLSGGQVQRVAAARMFVRNGQLIVFDDISSALDIETEKKLWTRLFTENKPTCIIVSNRRFALEQADNIILMKDGTIESKGKLNDLLKSSREMQQIWG